MTEAAAIAIFLRAIDLPAQDQEDFVLAQVAGDLVLHDRVMALIAVDAALDSTLIAETEPVLVLPPPRVGVWQLDEMIGAGGMGSVWRAHRDDGLFDQVVAVKFMRAQSGTIDLGPLIDAERRSLARMDHDNIARILDGGTTDDGLHYIVMEHVAGDRLDDHAATILPQARVALVRQAAAALAHAHTQGIVHCDVKPANLLVTPEGRVKLIDFGIARLSDGVHTLPDGLTRAYASPERLAGMPATTADDVWALAVTLREIVFDEPADGASDAGRLPGYYRDDLQAILDRATDPDPGRRYRSIDAFDTDLANLAASRPVSARRATAGYVIARFARRRPGTVTALVAALTGLVAGLAVIATLYVAAERARTQAETRFAELRTLARFMIFDLNTMLEQVPGATPARAALSAEAQGYLDTLADASGNDPALLAETADGLMRLAEVQGVPSRPNLGQPAEAAANLDRARGILDRLVATDDDPRLVALRGRVLYYRAILTGIQDQDKDAQLALARLAEGDVAPALARIDDNQRPELESLLLGIRLTQADALITAGEVGAALDLQLSEQARIAALPDSIRGRLNWSWEAGRLGLLIGDSLFWLGRKDEALAQYDDARAILAADSDAGFDRRLLTVLYTADYSRSATLADLGDAAGGLAAAEAALATATRVLAWDPTDRLAGQMVENAETQRALMLRAMGQVPEALALIEAQLVRLFPQVAPGDLGALRSIAVLRRFRAEMMMVVDGIDAGCAAYAEALVTWANLNAMRPLSEQDQETDLAPILSAMQANACPPP